jgi:hypothetical protein
MKNKKYIIELKDIKERKRFAPPTRKIGSKKIYHRKNFKLDQNS